MLKKIISILILAFCIFNFTTVNAVSKSNFIDLQTYTDVYEMSKDSDVSLPFVKIFSNKAVFDKNVNNSGISLASKTVDVNENLKGIQTIFSNDTITINGSLEYGVIIGTNVVISGNIAKDVLIMANSIFITDTANINGDAIMMARSIESKGHVAGNFIANAESLVISGKVDKDFRAISTKLEFNETIVNGNIYIETDSELNVSDKYPNAVIKSIEKDVISESEKNDIIIKKVIESIIAIVLFTAFNMLINKIFPNLFVNMKDRLKTHSMFTIIIGVISLITIPIILLVLLLLSVFGLSVLTLPLMVMYLSLIIVTISLAKFITGSVIYELLKDKLKINSGLKKIGLLASVFTVIYVLCNILIISWYMNMITVLLAAGIVFGYIISKITKKF